MNLRCSLRILVLCPLMVGLVPLPASAQDCATDCDVVVEPGIRTVDGTMVSAGDVVCLRAGKRGPLTLRDLIGTEAQPITVRACGGTVTLGAGSGAVLSIGAVSHVRITGEGGETPLLRIDGGGAANIGIHANGCAEHVELDHVEVLGTTYTALRVHAEVATCEVRHGLFVHHDHFHDLGGEGLFVGTNAGTTAYRFEGVRIEDNLIERTGFQGIKLGQVGDATVARNVLVDVGIGGTSGEDTGFAFGAGSVIRAEGNVVIRPASWCVGFGGRALDLVNNVFAGCGGRGMVVNGASDTAERRIVVLHNTFVSIHDDGFTHWAPAPPTVGVIANNLFVGIEGGTSITGLRSGGAWTLEGNLLFDDAAGAGLVALDPATVDVASLGDAPFSLTASSPARDAAVAVSGYEVATDRLGRARDPEPDVGAYEEGAMIAIDAGLDGGLDGGLDRGPDGGPDGGAGDAGASDADTSPRDASADAGAGTSGQCAASRAEGSFVWLALVLGALLAARARRRKKRVW